MLLLHLRRQGVARLPFKCTYDSTCWFVLEDYGLAHGLRINRLNLRFTCTYGGRAMRALLHLHLWRQYAALGCAVFCVVFGLHVATLLGTFDLSWGVLLC
jgi:hypothetical protein